jgi:CheY-like chemotaxis protein
MSNGSKGPTVLLVDDDDEVRRVLARGLERNGFRVVSASDERDAADRAAHDRPDLILLEMGRMPPRQVVEAGGRVRRGAGLPAETPVVVYAGGEDETVREGDEVTAGPAEYVVLPEDSEHLVRFLRRLAA